MKKLANKVGEPKKKGQPKVNQPKVNQATRQDSLVLYNNALAKDKFYKNNKEYLEEEYATYNIDFKNDKNRANIIEKIKKKDIRPEHFPGGSNNMMAVTKETYKRTGKVSDNVYSAPDMMRSGDDVMLDGYYNPKSPPIYISNNIKPQGSKNYSSRGRQDISSIPYYAPLAVKPFDLLTEKEKTQRVKQYGRAGVPDSYSNINKTKSTNTSKNTPTNIIKSIPRPKDTVVKADIKPADVNESTISAKLPKIYQQAKLAKYFNVEDVVNRGKNTTTYQYNPNIDADLRELSPESGDKRTITPKYSDGGYIGADQEKPKTPQQRRAELDSITKIKRAEIVRKKDSIIQRNLNATGLTAEEYKSKQKALSKKSYTSTGDLNVGAANKRGKSKGSCTTGTVNRGECLKDIRAYGGYINSNNNNDMAYARLPKNKRHIAPSAIISGLGVRGDFTPEQMNATAGGIAGGIGSFALPLVGGLLTQDAAEKARQQMLGQMLKQKNISDTSAYADYNANGNNDVSYYASGGELPSLSTKGKFDATGGALVPISSSAEVAVGNTHGSKQIDGQYGITLNDGQQDVAEIEHDEVVVDNEKVFSDRLKVNSTMTFADAAKKIEMKAGKLETKLSSARKTKDRNGIERMLAGTKMATDALFNKQEEEKEKQGIAELKSMNIPMGAFGLELDGDPLKVFTDNPMEGVDTGLGTYGDVVNPLANKKKPKNVFSYLAPSLMDNIGNAALTATSPKFAKPILTPNTPIETKFNVNPQIAVNRRATRSAADTILNNTSDSATARANIASTKLVGAMNEGNILGQKENIELGLRNQNIGTKNQVDSINAEKGNQFAEKTFIRAGDIQTRISGNLANLSEDVKGAQTAVGMDKYFEEQMLLELQNDLTGTKARAASENPYIMNNPKLAEIVNSMLKKR